jgi:hypothetical protein
VSTDEDTSVEITLIGSDEDVENSLFDWKTGTVANAVSIMLDWVRKYPPDGISKSS